MSEDAYLQERWAKAERIANGEEEPAIGHRRRWAFISASVLVAGALIGVVIALFQPQSSTTGEIETWRRVLSVVLAGIGAILIVGGLLFSWRARLLVPRSRSVLAALEGTQRRRAMRQIKRKVPSSAREVPVLRAIAAQIRRQWMSLALPGLGLILTSSAQSIASDNKFFQIIFAALSAGLVVVGVMARDEYRRAGNFLESTTSQESRRPGP